MSFEPDLRREVGLFRRGEHRRRFPAVISVGHLAGERADAEVPAEPDRQLCVDIAVVVLERAPLDATACWLTRPGVNDLHDLDNAWLAGTRMAAGILGRDPLPFFVITRAGWLDPVTGASRTWRRLRL